MSAVALAALTPSRVMRPGWENGIYHMKMKEWMMKKLPSIVVSLFAFIATVPSLADENTASASRETVEQEFRYEIPNIPGKVVTSLSVEYPPGASTPAHMHGDAFVIGYVVEGSIRSRGDGETMSMASGRVGRKILAHHTD